MRILVLGAGMYVTGRGTAGLGTVLPSLAQASKHLGIQAVTVAATRADNAEVVAQAAAAINAKLGTRLVVHYATSDELLAGSLENFDCAIVSVPDHLHFEVGRKVIEQGLHCLMVKPLTPTLAEAQELARLQQQHDVYAAVEFHKRYDDANQMIRRMLAEGCLGRLSYFAVEYSQRIDIPTKMFSEWASRTNIFQYLGVHYVDLVHYLTGFEPLRVMAHGTKGVLSQKGVDTFDSVHALVIWGNPADRDKQFTSQHITSWIDPNASSALSDQKYRLVGERGRFDCDHTNRGVNFVSETGVQAINPYFSEYLDQGDGTTDFSGYGPTSILRFIDDVAQIVAGQLKPEELEGKRPTFADSLPATAVLDAANKSLGDNAAWKEVS